jgi:hypothetical protein
MARLEDLQPTTSVRGILPDQLVTVTSVQWFGYDESANRYRGLRGGKTVSLSAESSGLLVKADVARRQIEAETSTAAAPRTPTGTEVHPGEESAAEPGEASKRGVPPSRILRRFHGTVSLDPTRVGRDASKIADEVISHLGGLLGSSVKVTLEIEAEIPGGTPENVVSHCHRECPHAEVQQSRIRDRLNGRIALRLRQARVRRRAHTFRTPEVEEFRRVHFKNECREASEWNKCQLSNGLLCDV